MTDIKSALVVMAKPKHTQVAFTRAQEIQRAAGAHLRLVSFCWNAMCEQADVFDLTQRRAMKKEIMRAREEWLRDQVLDAGLGSADVSIEVRWTNDIAGWVSAHALQGECDLVLKSVHHSESLIHTPLDWELLRQCPVPLYIAATRKRKPTGNILAALDFRHTDKKHQALNLRVLETAHRFAELSNAKLHCVNVVEFSQVLSDLDLIDTRKIRRQAMDSNRALMEALLEPFGVAKSRTHMPLGKVGQMVAATARKIKADLLVTGTSARRGAGVVLLGNSAERILSKVPCDVLAVHS
jgi:universal stress protein E